MSKVNVPHALITIGLYFMLYSAALLYGINQPGILECTIGASVLIGLFFLYDTFKLGKGNTLIDDSFFEAGILSILLAMVGTIYHLIMTAPCNILVSQAPCSFSQLQILEYMGISILPFGLMLTIVARIGFDNEYRWVGTLNVLCLLVIGAGMFFGSLVQQYVGSIPNIGSLGVLGIIGIMLVFVGAIIKAYSEKPNKRESNDC